MEEKRSRKIEEEVKEAKANEQIRRKAGKVSATLQPESFFITLFFRK